MEPKTMEGTWEEIARHGSELAGRRVRLTVLDEPGSAVALDRALAPLIAAAERLAESLQPGEPSPSPHDWGEGVLEKYRRQGFPL